jgi:hypothetical protein
MAIMRNILISRPNSQLNRSDDMGKWKTTRLLKYAYEDATDVCIWIIATLNPCPSRTCRTVCQVFDRRTVC